MKTFLAFIALPLLLAACSGMSSVPPSTADLIPAPSAELTAGSPTIRGARRSVAQDTCGQRTGSKLKNGGGKLLLPAIPSEFGGVFRYGALSGTRPKRNDEFEACDYNAFSAPVPSGYTADWFAIWQACVSDCDLSFGDQGLPFTIYHNWSPSAAYFMYIYTHGGALVESFALPPPKLKKKIDPYLQFLSPFQDGFTWPANDYLTLEIVHASQ